ncbi:MAG: phage major capsid protein [Hyphomonas sp.]
MPENYSFARALAFLADPTDAAARRAAEHERSASHAVAHRPVRGLAVPGDQLARAMNASTPGQGAELVATNQNAFAGALRAAAVVGRAGATMLTGLRGDAAIPTIVDGATAYWLPEAGNVTASTPVVSQGVIRPKTVAAAVAVSRRLLIQGNPDVAAVVAADLMAALAHEIDAAALGASSDAAAPTGLRQALAALRVGFAGAGPTWAEVSALLRAAQDGHAATPVFILSPDMGDLLRGTYEGDGQRVLKGGEIADQPALVTPAMPADELICGGFGDLIVAQWGGIDLRLDPAPGAANDSRILRAFADVGFLVRRLTSFAFGGAV